MAICDVDPRQIAHLKKRLQRPAGAGQGLRGLPQAPDAEKSVDAVVIAPGQRCTCR